MKPNALSAIALALGAGLLSLANAGCARSSSYSPPSLQAAIQNIEQQPVQGISGRVVAVDEDSFAFAGAYQAANFTFETLRVEADGTTYKFVLPGPSNYEAGDQVALTYVPISNPGAWDIIAASGYRGNSVYPLQKLFLAADGIVVRDLEGH